MKVFRMEINMKVNKEIKLNNGKIEIVTKQEHEFSEMEKKILNILALNGYYEIIGSWKEHQEEHDAINNLMELGLVKENYGAWHYTVEVVKTEQIGSFFLQILKGGV